MATDRRRHEAQGIREAKKHVDGLSLEERLNKTVW